MVSGTRGIPRFLPTLTEVVQPGAPLQPAAALHDTATEAPPAAPAPLPSYDEAQAARQARQLLALEGHLREQLEQRVRQIVEGALAAQVARITSQVMGELEPTLRQLARENGLRGADRSDEL